MPMPAYIVCSLTGSLDQYNNSVSCHQLIENVEVFPIDTQQEGSSKIIWAKPLSMRIVATWYREDGESPDITYEGELVARFPGQDTVRELVVAKFERFSFPTKYNRLIAQEIAFQGFPTVGLLLIECRIRRIGESEWTARQSYPIFVEAIEPPERPAPKLLLPVERN